VNLDAAGDIVAVETWAVACGPPPVSTRGQPEQYVTAAPFPGLTVVHSNCTADSVNALRAAAKASVALNSKTDHAAAHWVRDGYR
jgi:hypothetical protein